MSMPLLLKYAIIEMRGMRLGSVGDRALDYKCDGLEFNSKRGRPKNLRAKLKYKW